MIIPGNTLWNLFYSGNKYKTLQGGKNQDLPRKILKSFHTKVVFKHLIICFLVSWEEFDPKIYEPLFDRKEFKMDSKFH